MSINAQQYNEVVQFINDAKLYVKDIYAKLPYYSDDDKITWLEEVDDYNELIDEYNKYRIIYERDKADENVSIQHIVIEGDTLQKISVKYSGTHENWQRLYDFNNLSDIRLESGTTINIPKDLFLS